MVILFNLLKLIQMLHLLMKLLVWINCVLY